MFIGPCSIKIIGGSGHPELTAGIAAHLGVPISNVEGHLQANGEFQVVIGECLRDQDVYICQTGHGSVNDKLMELLIMISGCKAASARRITAGIRDCEDRPIYILYVGW